jgi:hypothetical protein
MHYFVMDNALLFSRIGRIIRQEAVLFDLVQDELAPMKVFLSTTRVANKKTPHFSQVAKIARMGHNVTNEFNTGLCSSSRMSRHPD